jgi:hypothetical protein
MAKRKSQRRPSSKKRPSARSSSKGKRSTAKPTSREAPALQWESGFWRQHGLAAALIVGLSLILYGYTLSFDYTLDDPIVITQNDYTLQGFQGIGKILTTEHFEGYLNNQKSVIGEQGDLVEGGRYRPLSTVTFAMEYGIWGANPLLSHLINVLLYGLTGLLLFRVVSILLPSYREKKWYYSLPLLAAALFILHPIHSEVVANIKGRDEILCLILALATMYYGLKYLSDPKALWLIVSGILFFLAIMAKENALTFFAVIPLSMYYFTQASKKQIIRVTALLGGVVLLYILLRVRIVGWPGGGKEVTDLLNNPFYGSSFGEKIATILYTWLLYLKLLIFPHPLTHDYYPFHIEIQNFANPLVWLSILLYIGMGVYALLDIKKKDIVSYGIWWYLLTFSIVSNLLISLGTFMNERFMYMPSVGFCLVLGFFLLEWLPKKLPASGLGRKLGIGILGLFVLGFSLKTWTRIPDWKNNLALDKAGVHISSNSAHSNQFYAYELYRKAVEEKDPAKKRALLDEADPHVSKALEIYPTYGQALTCKAGVAAAYYQLDRDLPWLLDEFFKLYQKRPDNPVIFFNQYLDYLKKRGQDVPLLVDFYYRIGYEVAYKQAGSRRWALKYLRDAQDLAPNTPRIRQALQEIQKPG